MKKAPLLVSACLAGQCCRYDGKEKGYPPLKDLVARGAAVPFCPEVAGGLSTPRPPAEIQGGDGADVLAGRARVVNREGKDVTAAYLAGARAGVELARRLEVRQAILKERSPACGVKVVHDGSFSGRLRPGRGVLAAALAGAGIAVRSEEEKNPEQRDDTEGR
jgi:uncharacterized protein YbbK (DUF523 family)